MNITESFTESSIVIQWDEVDDSLHTTYIVTWTSESDLNNVQANTLEEQSSYTITGLTHDTVYITTVTAANKCGSGPEYSTSVSLTIDITSTTSDITSTTSDISPTIITSINSTSFMSTENPSTTATTIVVLDSTIAGSVSVMMSSITTAVSTSIASSSSAIMIPSTAVSASIDSLSSSLMIPSTATSDIPTVATSATDVDTTSVIDNTDIISVTVKVSIATTVAISTTTAVDTASSTRITTSTSETYTATSETYTATMPTTSLLKSPIPIDNSPTDGKLHKNIT